MTHPYLLRARTPRVLAHRGLVLPDEAAAGLFDNTLTAIAAAQAVGAEYVETDCHLTADGVVVIFHDAKLTRVTGDDRAVKDVTHDELRAIMSDRGGLITLADALESFPATRFNVDVKARAAAEPVGRIVAAHEDRVLLTSFDDGTRRRALAAAARAGGVPATSPGRSTVARVVAELAVGARRAAVRLIREVDALQIPVRMGRIPVLTDRLIDAARTAGAEIHVWTINDPDEMRALVGRGVQGIVTDRADLALRALSA
ncbi:glycerophosphodiester phosphodiesterase family protein [Microbacterium gorillae]|uniref:glycerophosphodiester phosphodiesterase family protein n=1 Tax=Microbacterium gorillae TaxID=1231063 RepID=UPI00058CB1FF|nr:glycerophosphodiester phosphodiesterase family protein [Microbacterium gorillae]